MDLSTLATTLDPRYPRNTNVFEWLDYLLFVAFLVISAGIGIFFSLTGGKQKTVSEFLVGDRQLSIIPVTLSTAVSYISAITMIGRPSEMYLNGTMFLFADIGAFCGFVLIAMVFVPLLYPLKVISVFEFLERRYNSYAVRLLGNILFMLRNVISLGISLYAPCVALERATGGAILSWYSIIVTGAVATFYTSLGGLKAVIWTDTFQFVVMVAGMIIIIVKSTFDVGGMSTAWSLADKYQRIEFDEISPKLTIRHTVWGVIIGSFFDWFIIGISPAAVQRYCSLPSQNKARLSVLLSGPASIFITVGSCISGITVFAFYMSRGCDVYQAGWVGTNDQIIPYYIMDRLSIAGIPGIITAALFAGSLSNLSSGLSALSATTWEDILTRASARVRRLEPATATMITKLLVVLFGIMTTGMGILTTSLGGTVLQASMSFTGAIGGPFLGMFILGAFFKNSNDIGALIGPIVGVAFTIWLSIGAYVSGKQLVSLPSNVSNCLFPNSSNHLTTPVPVGPTTLPEVGALDSLYSISYLWYGPLGILITVVLGLMITGITGPRRKTPVNPQYVFTVGKLCGSTEESANDDYDSITISKKYLRKSSVLPINDSEIKSYKTVDDTEF